MDFGEQFKLEHMKCSNQLRIEEFKDRRAEIDVLIKDTKNLEIYAVAGIVIYYAWLITHCVPAIGVHHSVAWLIPVAVPVLGALRTWENVAQILNIASYILDVEESFAREAMPIGPQMGWEHYLKNRRNSPANTYQNIFLEVWSVENSKARIILWIVLIISTFGLFVLSFFAPLSACSSPNAPNVS